MMNKTVAILYTTVSSMKDAKKLAHIALSNHLAICVNIIPNGKSIYLWNGAIEEMTECYILFKTSIEFVNKLEQVIMENHPYDIPAILKFSSESSEQFFNYITKQV